MPQARVQAMRQILNPQRNFDSINSVFQFVDLHNRSFMSDAKNHGINFSNSNRVNVQQLSKQRRKKKAVELEPKQFYINEP